MLSYGRLYDLDIPKCSLSYSLIGDSLAENNYLFSSLVIKCLASAAPDLLVCFELRCVSPVVETDLESIGKVESMPSLDRLLFIVVTSPPFCILS